MNRLSALLLATGLVACSGLGSAARVDQGQLTAAAEASVERGVYITTECRRDGPLEALEIWGTGVGVWNRARQFAVSETTIRRILEAVAASGFDEMPDTFGGKTDPRTPPRDDGVFATEVVCLVRVDRPTPSGVVSKQVSQLRKGSQSPELLALAEDIFDLCAEEAKTGVEAESLADGLRKLANGTLSPEVFRAIAQRRVDGTPIADPTIDGFILRLDGRRKSVKRLPSDGSRGSETTSQVSAEDLRALAARLAATEPDGLPVNLYAPHYTDLTLTLLDQRVSIQAREFAGMTADTHGEAQARFDRLFEALSALASN